MENQEIQIEISQKTNAEGCMKKIDPNFDRKKLEEDLLKEYCLENGVDMSQLIEEKVKPIEKVVCKVKVNLPVIIEDIKEDFVITEELRLDFIRDSLCYLVFALFRKFRKDFVSLSKDVEADNLSKVIFEEEKFEVRRELHDFAELLGTTMDRMEKKTIDKDSCKLILDSATSKLQTFKPTPNDTLYFYSLLHSRWSALGKLYHDIFDGKAKIYKAMRVPDIDEISLSTIQRIKEEDLKAERELAERLEKERLDRELEEQRKLREEIDWIKKEAIRKGKLLAKKIEDLNYSKELLLKRNTEQLIDFNDSFNPLEEEVDYSRICTVHKDCQWGEFCFSMNCKTYYFTGKCTTPWKCEGLKHELIQSNDKKELLKKLKK